MILPFLLVFLIGMVEVTDALNVDRKSQPDGKCRNGFGGAGSDGH
jgi:hypothetical protein